MLNNNNNVVERHDKHKHQPPEQEGTNEFVFSYPKRSAMSFFESDREPVFCCCCGVNFGCMTGRLVPGTAGRKKGFVAPKDPLADIPLAFGWKAIPFELPIPPKPPITAEFPIIVEFPIILEFPIIPILPTVPVCAIIGAFLLIP